MLYFIIRIADTGSSNYLKQLYGSHFVYYKLVDSSGLFNFTADIQESYNFKSAENAISFWTKRKYDFLSNLPDARVSISVCSASSDEIERGENAHQLNNLYCSYPYYDYINKDKHVETFTFDDFKLFVSPALVDKVMQENPNSSNSTLFSNILVELNSAWETVHGKCTKWVPGHFE